MSAHQTAVHLYEDGDRNQDVVNEYADEIFSQDTDSSLVIVHLVYGAISDPGSIRRSAVRARNCYLNDLGLLWMNQNNESEPDANKHKTKVDVNGVHGEVLRRHIRYLDRSNTFLNLVGRCLRDKQLDKLTFDLSIAKRGAIEWCDVKAQADGIKFTYSKAFADILVPPSLAIEYLDHFYRNHKSNSNQQESELAAQAWETQFLVSRAGIFGNILDIKKQREMLSVLHKKDLVDRWSESDIKVNFWNLLGELQSALLYFRGALAQKVDGNKRSIDSRPPEGKVFARQVRSRPRNGGKSLIELPTAVTILCPKVSRDPSEKIIEKLLVKSTEEENEQDNSKQICAKIYPAFKDPATRIQFSNTVKKGFELREQKRRLECISLWMIWIIEGLHKSIHEGHALDFWFVAGDQTEFRDNNNIDFKELMPNQVRELTIPKHSADEKEFQNASKRAVRALEKEHFPWFQRGRYGLFWDIGRNSHAPTGLVAIKGSNWEQVLTESIKDIPNLDIPVCCITYTTGLPKEAGVISHTKLNGGAFPPILRWRKTQWQSDNDPRESELHNQLVNLLGKKPEQLTVDEERHLRDISTLCTAVADDPHAGAIMVILNDNPARKTEDYFHDLFAQMGKPWSIDNNREDRAALVSHDGATLITLKDRKWGYRFLLSPDGVDRDVRKKLVRCALLESSDFPLTGAGSRRWSAALTAFKSEVGAVIAISQDGDIYYWSSKDGKLNEQAQCLHFPVADEITLNNLLDQCVT